MLFLSRTAMVMKHTLKESETFDMFMRHLLKEFCSECLLSIIELMQFKILIFKEEFTQQRSGMLSHMMISGEDMEHFLIIPDEVSSVVETS